MDLHALKNVPGARKTRKRLGRGMSSGTGKTSGKGHKGQRARKGASRGKAGFEGGQMRLIRRLPKRGFKNPAGTLYLPVNVGKLSRYEDGAEVTASLLRESGLANGPAKGLVKILGQGELARRLKVRVHAFSATARGKIEAAGGTCEVVKG